MIELSVQDFLLYALFVASGLLIFVNLLHKWTGWAAKRRLRKTQIVCRICGYHFFAKLPANACPHCRINN